MTSLATPEQLPSLLRVPPWASGARAPEPPVLDLPPLQSAPRFTWTEEQRERVRSEAAAQLTFLTPTRRENFDKEFDRFGLREEARPRLHAGLPLTAGDFVDPPPEHPADLYNLLGLPDPIALSLWNSVDCARWSPAGNATLPLLLARLGDAAAPGLLAYARRRPVHGLRAARWLDAPELAALALKALRSLKVARGVATDWLLTHPATSAGVLLRQLFGVDPPAREDARAALHVLANKGLHTALEASARDLGEPTTRALREALETDPLLRLPERMPGLPTFFDAAKLHRPRLRSNGAALPDDALRQLGLMLAISRLHQPYAGIDVVRSACTEASLAAFAWNLFEAWWAAGAPSAHAWCFASLRLLHDESTAHRLGPRALRWAKDKQFARALEAIDMLAEFNSDAALMHIGHFVDHCKKPWVRDRAAAKIDAVADARGLSRIELADRLVPTLGLEDNRTLDFGARQFEIGFDETLTPFVRDAQRARLKDLPKPRQSDDAVKAEAASLSWKQLKKEMQSLARAQIARLEQAMVDQRRWSVEEFQSFFVRHPLTRELAARLIWSVSDEAGRPIGDCRIAEDGTLADAQDRAFEPPPGAQWRIAHPLAMAQGTREAFALLLADYEILQPFAQLKREVFVLAEDEAVQSRIGRFIGQDVATGAVIGLLEQGWLRGPTGDGGHISTLVRPLGTDGIQAALHLDPGMPVMRLSEFPRQTLGLIELRDSQDQPVAFGRISNVLCSELLRDLHRLTPLSLRTP